MVINRLVTRYFFKAGLTGRTHSEIKSRLVFSPVDYSIGLSRSGSRTSWLMPHRMSLRACSAVKAQPDWQPLIVREVETDAGTGLIDSVLALTDNLLSSGDNDFIDTVTDTLDESTDDPLPDLLAVELL